MRIRSSGRRQWLAPLVVAVWCVVSASASAQFNPPDPDYEYQSALSFTWTSPDVSPPGTSGSNLVFANGIYERWDHNSYQQDLLVDYQQLGLPAWVAVKDTSRGVDIIPCISNADPTYPYRVINFHYTVTAPTLGLSNSLYQQLYGGVLSSPTNKPCNDVFLAQIAMGAFQGPGIIATDMSTNPTTEIDLIDWSAAPQQMLPVILAVDFAPGVAVTDTTLPSGALGWARKPNTSNPVQYIAYYPCDLLLVDGYGAVYLVLPGSLLNLTHGDKIDAIAFDGIAKTAAFSLSNDSTSITGSTSWLPTSDRSGATIYAFALPTSALAIDSYNPISSAPSWAVPAYQLQIFMPPWRLGLPERPPPSTAPAGEDLVALRVLDPLFNPYGFGNNSTARRLALRTDPFVFADYTNIYSTAQGMPTTLNVQVPANNLYWALGAVLGLTTSADVSAATYSVFNPYGANVFWVAGNFPGLPYLLGFTQTGTLATVAVPGAVVGGLSTMQTFFLSTGNVATTSNAIRVFADDKTWVWLQNLY